MRAGSFAYAKFSGPFARLQIDAISTTPPTLGKPRSEICRRKIISYDPGSVALERVWQRGMLGQTRLLILFLGSEYDKDFLTEVIRFDRDVSMNFRGGTMPS